MKTYRRLYDLFYNSEVRCVLWGTNWGLGNNCRPELLPFYETSTGNAISRRWLDNYKKQGAGMEAEEMIEEMMWILICVWLYIINVGKVIQKPTRCNNNSFIDLQDQLNMFRANLCPSSGAQDWGFFTTYGIVSCKDGCTNSYVVRMWYVVLINVIMNWWVCYVMFRYLLVLYSNVYGKIVAYVVVREFVFWVRGLLCWEMWWLIGRVYCVN